MTENTSDSIVHFSDCAVHNMPAKPAGRCDCGARDAAHKDILKHKAVITIIREKLAKDDPSYARHTQQLQDAVDAYAELVDKFLVDVLSAHSDTRGSRPRYSGPCVGVLSASP